jgi:Toprim domain/CHC2 zinc finger
MIPPDRIAAARAVPIKDAAERLALPLRPESRVEFVGPCPVCGGDDRFSVNTKKGVFHCRSCRRGGDVLELVRFARGCHFDEAIDWLIGEEGAPRRSMPPSLHIARAPDAHLDERGKAEWALRIWDEAVDPRGTIVEKYLAMRALELPPEAAGEALRFHPSCPFAGQKTPAMVALVRNIVSNAPQAIHRTALTPDGQKRKIAGHARLSLGPTDGAAVKLTPDEHVTYAVGIGEGIESALSLRAIPKFGPLTPTWAVLNAAGVAKFPLLPAIESLWIGVDNDEAGIGAADAAVKRWTENGREVFKVKSRTQGEDLNDLAIRRRVRH